MAIRVLIVGDIRLYREGLEHVLSGSERVTLVGTASCGEEAIERTGRLNPDIVLLDMAMRDAHSTVQQMTHIAPDTKVVALAVPEIDSEVIACAEAGVAGYVTREGSLDDVIQIIEAAAKGELRCSARIAGSLLRRIATLAAGRHEPGPMACLTNRESDIMALIEEGLSNKEIARKLGIEVATVKNHVHNILEKLHVHRRGEAAAVMRHLRARHDPTFMIERGTMHR